ncbi:DUF2530 domain-containing protein [Cellulomonas carbonis]|uniref:DUF2530 domain-containing protein n=1 Tax=Cellulomonas carbonis T26 TaxID=947969 RepID=A0A0A0BP72_9CELL|nr:DUF2530 domain-containing protein [Cellulomonas carbonis]KGM10263.1 hypothetical protein N868_15790 [Cellulomonas carbonis T26]
MTRRPRLLEPSRLAPVQLDVRRVFLVGIAVWVVALVVTLVLLGLGRVEGRAVATCATGVVLGLLALVWERRHRSR